MVNVAAIMVVIQLFIHQAGQLKEDFIILKSIVRNLLCTALSHCYCCTVRVTLFVWLSGSADSACAAAKEMNYIPYEADTI